MKIEVAACTDVLDSFGDGQTQLQLHSLWAGERAQEAQTCFSCLCEELFPTPFFTTFKRDFLFLLGIKGTVIKLRLQVNAVTLDLILIRQAWKNENCCYQLCQLSIWWCLGGELHSVLKINWLSTSQCSFRALQTFINYNAWHPSRCWTDLPEMAVQEAQQITNHKGLRLLSVPHPISDLIFALPEVSNVPCMLNECIK